MPIPFALVPDPAPCAVAGSGPPPPQRGRESRLFHASALASALALLAYGLFAAAWPLLVPALAPKVVDIPYPAPHAPLPPLEQPRAQGREPAPSPPPETAPPEPHPRPVDRGVVIPVVEPDAPAPAPAGEAGGATTKPVAGPAGAPAGAARESEAANDIVTYWEQAPEVVRAVKPDYPQIAQDAGVSGTVLLQVLVGRDGRVEDVKVVRSIPLLDGAAAEAARRWRFRPALVSGRPVRVWVALPVRFNLH